MMTISRIMRDEWLTIGRYYAYGECIENRVAAISSVRAYPSFFNEVFTYVSLFLCGDKSAVTLQKQEQRIWEYISICHDKYLELLKGKLGYVAARGIDLTYPSGRNNFQSVENSYKQLIKIDNQPCVFAKMMSMAKEGISISAPKDVIYRIIELLEILEKFMNVRNAIEETLDRNAKAIQDIRSGQQQKIVNRVAPRYPRSVHANLFVFVSHLGRFVAWQCNEDETEKIRIKNADNELSNSIQHLHRAILDACKLLLETILRRGENIKLKRQNNLLTESFWNQLLEVRKLEHDRLEHTEVEFDKKINAYKKLFFPGVDDFLQDLKSIHNIAL